MPENQENTMDDKHCHNFVGLPNDGWYTAPRDEPALFGETTSLVVLGQLRHAHDGLEVHLHYQNGYATKPLSGNGPSLYVFGETYEKVELQEGQY